jgi:biotin operon repressor
MEKVVNYISAHGDRDNPVSNGEISSSLKLSEQSVRKKINEARSKGIPVCSCNHGYYVSEDKAEILQTVQSLMHRTMAVENAITGLLTVLRKGLEDINDA